jgi:DNA-binding HxlR family transcriptional regulator
VHPYGQYCPVARAAEILADRWTVLIVRELLADITHFNDLERGLPGVPRSLLAERLQRLVQAGVLERHATSRGRSVDYRLTEAGRELQQLIDMLGAWGARWAFGDPRPDELDPIVLLWWMRRRVSLDRIPRRRIVIEFEFRGSPSRHHHWLVIEPTGASVCLKGPGFDTDVLVTADITAFYRVWLGHIPFAEAVRRGEVCLDGIPADIRSFQHWFAWSPMADTVRAALVQQQARPS